MALAVLVGLPREQVKRLKAFIEGSPAGYEPGWSVQYVVARRNNPEIQDAQINEAMELAATTEGSHIVGVSTQDGAIRRQIGEPSRDIFDFAG